MMSDTQLVRSGSRFDVVKKQNMVICEHLPVGTYIVKYDELRGCFFYDQTDNFELSTKLYGNTTRHAERIINTFKDRPAGTGVLLTGEKGSGKTLLAKQISIDCAKLNIPTILVNQPFHGDKFTSLLQGVTQPAVVMFDEFEKVYDEENQPHMLSLLDGFIQSPKLFILTCNDKWRIDRHMRNRPGRLYYSIDFSGLDNAFVDEYCRDNLHNHDNIDGVLKISKLYNRFNFDMLKAMVEEMNRYNETAQQCVELLNVKPENGDDCAFTIKVLAFGLTITPDSGNSMYPRQWHGNPLDMEHGRLRIEFRVPTVLVDNDRINLTSIAPALAGDVAVCDDSGSNTTEIEIYITPDHLKRVDPYTGAFTFVTPENYTVVIERVKDRGAFDYSMLV